MAAALDQVYDDARVRVCDLARSLSTGQLDTVVPATPAWTARQLVAHLAAVASDALTGRTAGRPGPAWTAVQAQTGKRLRSRTSWPSGRA